LRDLDYVEGRNLVIEFRDAEGKLERLPALAVELVALKVDVIVAGGGTPTALAAKQATRTLCACGSSEGAACGAGGVMAWGRGAWKEREGAEGVDVDFYEAAGRVNS
jgi:putative ABC transport system substrate-binding protein